MNILLSHSTKDNVLASAVKEFFDDVSLGSFKIWFSSDKTSGGGLAVGNWYDQIREELKNSKAIMVLLTPNSVDSRWVHFESGVGEGTECAVIPICMGISTQDIPLPLSSYQSYQLSDYESLKTCATKILELGNLEFRENTMKDYMIQAISKFTSVSASVTKKEEPLNLSNVIQKITTHMDKRIDEIKKPLNHEDDSVQYAIKIRIDMDNLKRIEYLEITKDLSVSDVLDNIYFMIQSCVDSYHYLDTWILEDDFSKKKLIMNEIIDQIPAHYVFTRAASWVVKPLQKSYSGYDSINQGWFDRLNDI
ncbi:MAG: TIR domain-containing protein [Nitrosopumilus sp.]|nr:MAG: TIR domain-containing protein [Nitrosopumilus sp.]